MDLQRQVSLFRKWLPVVAVAIVIAAGIAFVVSGLQSKVFESKTTLIVGESLTGASPDYTQLLASQRLSTTYAARATSGPILQNVIDELDLETTPEALRRSVSAEAPTDSTLVTITAQAGDPDEAANIANEVADQLIAATPQGRAEAFRASIDADLAATQAQIESTRTRIEELVALEDRTAGQEAQLAALEDRIVTLRATFATLLGFSTGSATNLLGVVDPAVPASSPVAPRTLLNVILAALLAAVVAAGIVLVIGYFDDTMKSAEDVEEATGLATLGSVWKMKGGDSQGEMYRLATLLYPRSRAAEAYRTLRANVEFASVDRQATSLLVTSSMPREGKTVTACNLAVVLAQAGRRVLLVDSDLRRPGVHLVFNADNGRGLTTLLRGDGLGVDEVSQATELANLRILSTGPLPPNPAEILGSQRMRLLLERLRASADILVFDSPPLQAVTDAAIISSFVDATVLVIDASRSRRAAVRRSREALARAGANTIGAVLNRVPAPSRGDQAAYYGDYYGSPEGAEPQAPGRGTSTAP